MRITEPWLSDPGPQAVCRMLTEAGYQALFVGGCVRNALMGVAISDIDITTDARPEDVVSLAKAAGLRPVPTGIEHGTVTVVAGGIGFEVTTFRRDVETDGRRAVVAFADTVEEDAHRRDFTFNALYARPDGSVVDPLGGLADLHARRVRFIDDPVERIREDYLRILRFFRFHAWYGDPEGGLDPAALAAIATHLDGLAGLSRERVGAEIRKLLAAPDPAPAVGAMAAVGALGQVLPGARSEGLAVLVHLELEAAVGPDPIRRLAVLSGQDEVEHLRLSKAETRKLGRIRDHFGRSPEVLGYRIGIEDGMDTALVTAAVMEQPLPENLAARVRAGAEAVFPISANDLMPRYQGPALGKRMKTLEDRWIQSGFVLKREDLLGEDRWK